MLVSHEHIKKKVLDADWLVPVDTPKYQASRERESELTGLCSERWLCLAISA